MHSSKIIWITKKTRCYNFGGGGTVKSCQIQDLILNYIGPTTVSEGAYTRRWKCVLFFDLVVAVVLRK